MGKNKNSNISPEEEEIYKEIIKNLNKIYQLKRKDNRDIKKFDTKYANMFQYEDNLYGYLDEFAGNIDRYGDNYYKELNKYIKAYEKSLKDTTSIFKNIINRRKKVKKYIEKTIKLIKELEDI